MQTTKVAGDYLRTQTNVLYSTVIRYNLSIYHLSIYLSIYRSIIYLSIFLHSASYTRRDFNISKKTVTDRASPGLGRSVTVNTENRMEKKADRYALQSLST